MIDRTERSKGMRKRNSLYAAIDLGTNNCRLLIAEKRGNGFRVVDSYSQIVRLGEGLAANGALSQDAITRAIQALSVCKDKIEKNKVVSTRCITTQASRVASNGAAFLKQVKSEVGLKLETISAKEEAKLALIGCLDLIDDSGDFALVIDIGGGSTELCWVDARTARKRGLKGSLRQPPILGWTSFPLGVVTLSEQHPESGEDWYQTLCEHVSEHIKKNSNVDRFRHLFEANRGFLIGTSGTVTSMSALALGLKKYNRGQVDGSWIEKADLMKSRQRLQSLTIEERGEEPVIGPDRADLILSGCAILESIWNIWPSDRLRVADRGLREGILVSMMHGKRTSGSPKNKRRNQKTENRSVSSPSEL